MKKQLFCLIAGTLFTLSGVRAQDYEHLGVTSGFNACFVAHGILPAGVTTSIGVDNDDNALMDTTFAPVWGTPGPSYALPSNGLINSSATAGLSFQLGDYANNDDFRMAAQNIAGTLEFEEGVQAKKLYLLAMACNGSASISVTVHFTDDTSQTLTDIFVPDWYSGTEQPIVLQGFGRTHRPDNVMENPAGNPRLYQLALELLAENQVKTIDSISITKTSAEVAVVNVLGVTAELAQNCAGLGDLASAAGPDSAVVTWTAAATAPSGGYDYYVSTSFEQPTEETGLTGNVPAGTTTLNLNDLPTGVLHFVWVRSNCGEGGTSQWQITTFKTGQISVVYNAGDISTLYDEAAGVDSANSCPATMSVTIPDGYQVSNVFTMYSMTAQDGALQSQQRSLLACATTGAAEAAIAANDATEAGTMGYARNNIAIANGATGTVNFELRAWRTWGGADCSTTYNKVDNNSWRLVVDYTLICTAPANPAAADQLFCNSGTVGDLVATGAAGSTIKWYGTASGGSALAADTALATATYYVSQTVGGCESDRVAVDVAIITMSDPIVETVQVFCGEPTVADLAVTGTGGAIKWYATEGGAPLAASAGLTTGNYFVRQNIGICESHLVEVNVTVYTVVPAPAAVANQSFCGSATVAELAATAVNGAVLTWYDAATGGEALTADTALSTTAYYVSQMVDECESARTAVNVIVNIPLLPVLNANQSFCGNAAISNIAGNPVDGGTFKWYATATATVALPQTTALATGTYYVRQTVNGCQSDAVAVAITINTVPEAPEGDDEQDFTDGATVSDLEVVFADGAEATWYIEGDEGEFIEIPADSELADGFTFYVTQITDVCESDMLAITVHETLGTGDFAIEGLVAYPNPVADVLTISAKDTISEIVVTDLLGQVVLQQKADGNTVGVNVSKLSQGTYIVQVYAEGKSSTVKIVRQ
jgi:hypothetical protein